VGAVVATNLAPIALYSALSCPINETELAVGLEALSLLLGRATGTLAAPVLDAMAYIRNVAPTMTSDSG
jgi:hypothetical protein